MDGIYESGENYLETILVLSNRTGSVRSIDIAREMNLSKPSVSRAMGVLKGKELIDVDGDGFITLTKPGKRIATRIYERHVVLTDILIKLGVDAKTAAEDACRIEHDISDKTFSQIKKHMKEHKE